MPGDNLFFEIRSCGKKPLECAVQIAYDGASGGKATHYVEREVDGVSTLILLWHEERGAIKLPFPLTVDKAADFVQGWLDNCPKPKEPDHDGDNNPGFRIFVDSWGQVNDWTYSFMGVEFHWQMYGK
jgi:hypothetical protein